MCSLSVIGSGPILGPLAGPAGDAPVLPTDTDTCTDADMRETRGVFLMRVALPDRPGSLGAVASALGGPARPLQAEVTALNDQHTFLRFTGAAPCTIGDVVTLGLSHPCTAFDKWRLIPLVDAETGLVREAVETFF